MAFPTILPVGTVEAIPNVQPHKWFQCPRSGTPFLAVGYLTEPGRSKPSAFISPPRLSRGFHLAGVFTEGVFSHLVPAIILDSDAEPAPSVKLPGKGFSVKALPLTIPASPAYSKGRTVRDSCGSYPVSSGVYLAGRPGAPPRSNAPIARPQRHPCCWLGRPRLAPPASVTNCHSAPLFLWSRIRFSRNDA